MATMVVLVLLGLVERVVHQNGGKGGEGEDFGEDEKGSGVETSNGAEESGGAMETSLSLPALSLRYQKGLGK